MFLCVCVAEKSKRTSSPQSERGDLSNSGLRITGADRLSPARGGRPEGGGAEYHEGQRSRRPVFLHRPARREPHRSTVLLEHQPDNNDKSFSPLTQ